MHQYMTSRQFLYKDDEIAVPAAITEDIFHYCVHEKIAFTMDVAADIDGSSINIAFKTGSAAKYVHMMYDIDANAAANFSIYVGGTMSIAGGTDIEPVNRNQIPPLGASTMEGFGTASWVANKVTLNTVITVGTAKILRHRHIGSGRKVGGSDDAAWEFMFPAETICAIEIDDDAGAANIANLVFSWFEVPPAP